MFISEKSRIMYLPAAGKVRAGERENGKKYGAPAVRITREIISRIR
jgi:hypothetical protein